MHKSDKSSLEKNGTFPIGFLWGTATAAHQVEGNNKNNDWWLWEKKTNDIPDSEIACDHYHLYEKDLTLAKEFLNSNAYRFSIEWSRVEKKEGVFDDQEILHYQRVLGLAKKLGLKTIFTLHHFTSPIWFIEKGGWEKKENIKLFDRFVDLCVKSFKNYVDYWITINEPNVYASMAYFKGFWPPEKKSLISTLKVYGNLISAHKRAYKIIHNQIPNAQVSCALNMVYYHAEKGFGKFLAKMADFIFNHSFIIFSQGFWDFIGINYYYMHVVSLKNFRKVGDFSRSSMLDLFNGKRKDLGFPVYPTGLYQTLGKVWEKYHIPIIVTENGISDKEGLKGKEFLKDNIYWLKQAIDEGIDIRGYIYWSLMDNIEWTLGKKAKFGLFRTDYASQKRIPKPSAYYFSEISKYNTVIDD